MQIGVNLCVLALFALLAVSSYRHFALSGNIRSFGVLVVNALFLGLFVARSPARSESTSPGAWLLGVAGTALPLLMRPGEVTSLTRAGEVLQIAGLIALAAALLSLRRSFAIVAANRGVRIGGLYRLVRHPLYVSELIVFLGVVLASPSIGNIVVWLCECGLQFARACVEERFLAADPAYVAYRERVRYRLIPGLV